MRRLWVYVYRKYATAAVFERIDARSRVHDGARARRARGRACIDSCVRDGAIESDAMDATCAPPPARPNCDCGARDATLRDATGRGTTRRRRAGDRGSRARGRGRDLDGARATARGTRAGRGRRRPRDRGSGETDGCGDRAREQRCACRRR